MEHSGAIRVRATKPAEASHPRLLRRVGFTLLCLSFLVGPAGMALALRVNPASPGADVVAVAPAEVPTTQDVGPGPVRTVLRAYGYRLELRITPNRVSTSGLMSVELSKAGHPVNGAHVAVTFTSLNMKMPRLVRLLPQTGQGRYLRPAPALRMGGRWRLHLVVAPTDESAFVVTIIDRVAV